MPGCPFVSLVGLLPQYGTAPGRGAIEHIFSPSICRFKGRLSQSEDLGAAQGICTVDLGPAMRGMAEHPEARIRRLMTLRNF